MEKIPKELEAVFEPGERPAAAVKDFSLKPKFVVVTDRRGIIWRKGFVGAGEEVIPFERISHVGLKRGMASDELTINMGGHIIKVPYLNRGEGGKGNYSTAVFDAINEGIKRLAAKPYCPFCGAQLVSGAAFCPGCGKKVRKVIRERET